MYRLSPELLGSFRQRLIEAGISVSQRSYYLRWLSLYRSACEQQNLNPDAAESLETFLAGLRQGRSSEFLIGQARHAIELATNLNDDRDDSRIAGAASVAASAGLITSGEDQVQAQLALISERVRARRQRSIANLIADGHDLRRARALLPHGRFGDWLGQEFEMSYVSALRMMQAAEAFGDKITIVKDLSKRALYELASPGTSASIRATVLAGLEAGETFTYAQIRDMKQKGRVNRSTRPERSIGRSIAKLNEHMNRWTRRTRRLLGHYRLSFDAAEGQQIDALQSRLDELYALLEQLREPAGV